jgi:hypothetical protein
MNKELNEQNGNERNISNRVLSWFGEHKMKLVFLFVVGILFGGTVYLAENKDTFKISVDLKPEIIQSNERLELTVKIIPLEQVKGEFEIEVKPENNQYIHILESGAKYDPEKQSWTINLGELDLKVGMDWPYIYYFTADTERTASTWEIDVTVRYIPEISPESVEEHYVAKYFTVEKKAVPPPSRIDKIRHWSKKNLGFCSGTEMIVFIALFGFLFSKRRGKICRRI